MHNSTIKIETFRADKRIVQIFLFVTANTDSSLQCKPQNCNISLHDWRQFTPRRHFSCSSWAFLSLLWVCITAKQPSGFPEVRTRLEDQTTTASVHSVSLYASQWEPQQNTLVCKRNLHWQKRGRGENGGISWGSTGGESRPLWLQGRSFFEGHKAKLRGQGRMWM